MRRIKSARLRFYSVVAGSSDFLLPTVIEANDLYRMRAVVKAAEARVREQRIGASNGTAYRLACALSALNAPEKGRK
jgi:hypothetical protein